MIHLAIFLILTALSWLRYFSLHTAVFDMGVFQRHLFMIGSGEWQWVGFGHFWPLIFLYAWIHKFTSPYFLLALQVGFIALGGEVIEKTVYQEKSTVKASTILIYYLFFGLWFNALFDFHLDHLVIPLTAIIYYLFLKEKFVIGAIISCLLGFVKEPFFLVGVAFGFYLILKHRCFKLGLTTIIFCSLGFWLAVTGIIPYLTFNFSPLESPAFAGRD